MYMKYLGKTPSKSDKKIKMIARAAAKLFSEKGYIETSMEDIAAAAKLSKGGMYHYFKCKEDMLYFVLSSFMDFLLETLEHDLDEIENPVEKTRYIIRNHVESYVTHMYSAKALLNEAYNLSKSSLLKIKSKEKQYFSIITRTISLYVGHTLDKDKLTVVTFNLLGMCNWIYSWYNPQGPINTEQLSQIIFENFTKGLSCFQTA